MFDHKHYVPILKAKEGEFGALSELTEKVKKQITPVIDIYKEDNSGKALDVYLHKIGNKILSSWGDTHPIFVDLFGINLKDRVSDGSHPLTYLFDHLRTIKVKAIPLTGFDRDEAYNEALSSIIKNDEMGFCVRILADDMVDTDDLSDNLNTLLVDLNVAEKSIHLLLDFRELKIDKVPWAVATAINTINNLPSVNTWNTLTVAASGFPGSLADVGTQSVKKIPRTEFLLWKALFGRKSEINRMPAFGDYGVAHPDLLSLDWRKVRLVPNVRYTLPTEWLVLRGGTNKKYGSKQTHKLSGDLVKMSEYYGESYCWGDNYIKSCAGENIGPGNMSTWRKIGTNHHLTLVASQIAIAAVS